MANLITGCRIACSIALLFPPAFSPVFFVLYLLAGLTDMIDGTVARKTNTVSEFGSRLDSAADFLFVAVCLGKLLPVLEVPPWLWAWIAVIAGIKLVNAVSGWVVQKKIVTAHTIMNKITGFLLFLLPLTFSHWPRAAIVVCTVATFAAIQEGHFILKSD